MRRAMLLFSLVVVLLQVGCSKPALTNAVRDRYGLTDADVGRLQLYTSDTIVLRREMVVQKRDESEKALAIRDELKVEEVVIPAGTPGVAIRATGDAILVSFSREEPDRALWFGLKKRADDGSDEPLRYELMPLEGDEEASGEDRPTYAKGFLVRYGSKKYHVADGKMWRVHLLYDLDAEFADEVVREKAPGWRLSEGTAGSLRRSKVAKPTSNDADSKRLED